MIYKIGWFSTGRDQAARELLQTVQDNIKSDLIKAQLEFVFSNREEGEAQESDKFFDLVKNYGINLVTFSSKNFKPEMRQEGKINPVILKEWRRQYDREIVKKLSGYTVNLSVLAGYMLVVSDELCNRYDMINLHPAAPDGPAGTWQEVIWKLIEAKAEKTGLMMHLVTEDLDEGAPITYYTFPIKGEIFDQLWQDLEDKLKTKSLDQIIAKEGEDNPLFKEIRHQGVIRELPLIVHTLKEFADGKMHIKNGQVIVNHRVCKGGYSLNEVC